MPKPFEILVFGSIIKWSLKAFPNGLLTLVTVAVLEETAFSCFGILHDRITTVNHWQCWNDTVPISKGHLPLSQYPEHP